MNYLKTPWTSQPQQAVGIDWSNPITRGLISLPCVLGGRVVDAISGVSLSRSGSATLAAGSDGIGVRTTASADVYSATIPTLSVTGLSNISFISLARTDDNSMTRKRVVRFANSTLGTIVNIDFGDSVSNYLSVGVQSASSTFPACVQQTAYSANKRYAIVGRFNLSAGVVEGFDNGVAFVSTASTTGAGLRGNIDQIYLGNNASGLPTNGHVYLAGLWNRALSDLEIRSISQNPWQIFKPLPRRIFAPVSAVSSDTLLYPSKGSLVTSGYTPTITQPGSNTTLSPSKGSLALTGKTPTLTQPNALTPSKAAAIFSGKQPTISQTANQTLSPSKVSLVFSGKTPTIDQTAANSILPGTGHYYTTGKTPTVTQPNSIAPSKRAVALTGYQPTVLQSFSINPTTGAVVITGKTPSITQPNAITPLVAHAILTGKTPIISDSTPMTDSQKLDLIIDILSNKQTLNPTTGIYTLYADDGTTVLMTAQAWEDAAGTIPYRGKALQRLDAMN